MALDVTSAYAWHGHYTCRCTLLTVHLNGSQHLGQEQSGEN